MNAKTLQKTQLECDKLKKLVREKDKVLLRLQYLDKTDRVPKRSQSPMEERGYR